ncbi:endolysin [Mycobacterium phage Rey]|uniref:Lysin B n=1 Tax=Mycobacterium phage Rey TaxID=1034115 RepID=G1D5A5_9CAUD|nr:endolysin [Mycobacterium phage Rey]AEK09955.1 lysin B [Mycobacterium phage Rey]
MAWIGWQEGMEGLPVLAAIGELRAKFSYGKQLGLTKKFTPALTEAVKTFQRNKGGLRTDGVLDYETQKALGVLEALKPWLFTVAGTGAFWDAGYPADIARAVADLYRWQGVNYPATAFPMGDSVDAGIAELVKLIKQRLDRYPAAKFVMIGYSQGAIVTSMVWKRYIKGTSLEERIIGSITYGNPCRELGVANGNVAEGIPVPEGRGIADDRLQSTPLWWYDFAHGANSPFGRDIYTDTPDDDAGEMMTAVYRAVQKLKNLWSGVDSILEQVGEIIKRPIPEIYAAFRAIVYGGQFVTTQPWATYPHTNYTIDHAVAILRRIAKN